MPDKDNMHPEYIIRIWTLENSIKMNDGINDTKKIIADAKTFYGYLFPDNGQVVNMEEFKKSTKLNTDEG